MEWRQHIPRGARIALVGKHPDTARLAPFHDSAWTIWTLNDAPRLLKFPRWDALFELHDDSFASPLDALIVLPGTEHHAWLAAQSAVRPIVTTERKWTLEQNIVLPREEIEACFRPVFSSTAAWMMALAILCRPRSIGVYGFEMVLEEEYHHQRPGLHYLIGRAEGSGIDVMLPVVSRLLPPVEPYGYWQEASCV